MMATSDERDILTLALMGTRHSGGATPQTTPPVDQLPLAEGEAERALLLRAGAWAIYRRAGYLPADAPEPPTPAPADARLVCTPEAGEAIATLLRSRRFDLLPEALERLNAAGLRLPPATLPLALSGVGMPTELRAALAPALGERGRWLAGFNRAWSWAVEPLDDALDEEPARAQELWDTGTLRQRVAALRSMRRRDPDTARDLLAAEWKREKAEARAALLATLAVNLSLADEPLLNQAVADRVEAVASSANDLLARLPESNLAKATLRVMETMLTFTGGTLDAKPPVSLIMHLQYVPPEHWEAYFGQPADQLIAATEHGKWRNEMLSGWHAATVRFGSNHWALALWDGWLHKVALGAAAPNIPVARFVAALAPLLPRETLRMQALLKLVAPSYKPDLSLAQTLACLPRPWEDDMAIPFLEKLRTTLDEWDGTTSPSEPWISALPLAAIALPANQFALAREICAIADEPHRNLFRWRYLLAHFTADLFLRERYIREIPLP